MKSPQQSPVCCGFFFRFSAQPPSECAAGEGGEVSDRAMLPRVSYGKTFVEERHYCHCSSSEFPQCLMRTLVVGWEKSRVLVDGGCGARNSSVEVGGVKGAVFYGKRMALRIE